ncbi:MAG: amino acid ABC transporter permease [Spirochaetales bacterium]|jgi:polar amino acid transport system permease protein|nr:amino acid ABC transporter permease [Spirochaetales bacterium]
MGYMVDTAFIVKFTPLYIEAMGLVLELCFFGVLFSLIIGLFCAIVRYYRIPVLRSAAGVYIELSRNTPLVIQLFFLYFGLPRVGITFDSFTCAVTGLSFLGGSYMAEAFRGGLEAIGRGQIESGLSIGLSRSQLVRYVALPQALAVAAPALGANVIFLLKETSVVSIVALADLMSLAKDLIGLYYKTNEALLMLVAGYLILLLPLSGLFRFAERRLRYAGFGN